MLHSENSIDTENYDLYILNIKSCKPIIEYKLNLHYLSEKYYFIEEKNLALLISGSNIGIYRTSDYQNDELSLKLYFSEIKICQINSGFFAILEKEILLFLEIKYDNKNNPIQLAIPKIINLKNYSDYNDYNFYNHYYHYNGLEYIGKNYLIFLKLLFSFEKKGNSLIIKSQHLKSLFGYDLQYITQIVSDKNNNQLALLIMNYYDNYHKKYNILIWKTLLCFYDMNEIYDEGKKCNIKKVLKLKDTMLHLTILNKDIYFCYNNSELYLISSKYLEIISIYKFYPLKYWNFIKILNNTKMIFFYKIFTSKKEKKSLHIYNYANNQFKLMFKCYHKKKVMDKKIIISKNKKNIKLHFINYKKNVESYTDDSEDNDDSDDNDDNGYYSEDNNLHYTINNHAQKIIAKKNKKHLKELGAKQLNKKQKKGIKKIRVNIKNKEIDIFNY